MEIICGVKKHPEFIVFDTEFEYGPLVLVERLRNLRSS